MAEIDAALGRAAGGEGGLVLLVGEAGVGKSRLVREARTRALSAGATVLFGRASDVASPVPFRPLAEALLGGFATGPDFGREALAPFAAVLGRVVPEWASTSGSVTNDVGGLAVGEAIVRLLAVEMRRSTLLLLEDLHWADPETTAVVEYLADHLARTRTVCLATVRAGERSGMERLARRSADRRTATVIDVRPLSDPEVARLTAGCLGADGVPGELLAMVTSSAEGIPLVVEELLATLADERILVDGGSRTWHIRGEVVPRVPASLAEGVARRLDSLGEEHRHVLRAAALLGRRFDWTLLTGVSELPDRTVIEALRHGVAAQLLAEDGDAFVFRHALTREAVLHSQLGPERQRLARRALDTVEAAHPELQGLWCDVAAELAQRAGERKRAAALLVRSATVAIERGAPSTATASLARARSLAEGDPMLLARIDEAAAHAAALAGDVERAMELARAVDAAPGETLEGERRATLALTVARSALQAGHWTDAFEQADAARSLSSDGGGGPLATRATAVMAQAALGDRRPDEAVALARAVTDAGPPAPPDAVCEALEVLGREARLRNLVEAEQHFERARVLAERHGLTLWRARALHELGTIDLFTTLRTDRLDAALVAATDAGALATLALVDLHRASIALSAFEAEPACDAAARSADLSRRLGLATLPMALVHLAAGHALAGRAERMEEVAADALASGPDDPEVEAGVPGRCRALFHIRNGNWSRARVCLDDAVAVLRRHEDLWFPLFGLWALLRAVEGIDGQAAVDEAELRPGADIAFNRARVLLARAVLAGRSGDATVADELLGRAEAVASGLTGALVWTSVERVLVAPAAAADGWGNPVEWSRQALALFEDRRLPELAGAVRRFLRAAGQPVPRRGRGDTAVPSALAAVGVTTREADVLRLLAGRLSNRAIGERLHLSPRTVERHVANLLLKVKVVDRYALADEARRSGLVMFDD